MADATGPAAGREFRAPPDPMPPPIPGRPRQSQWDGSPWPFVLTGIAFLLVLVAAYRVGVPMLAQALADRLPMATIDQLSDQVLRALDGRFFEPSALPAARQQQIVRAFEDLRAPDGRETASYTIVFRNAPSLGANALALPSGTIVVTDGLMKLASDDREILGTLAHEAGHVERRHGLRLLLQNSVVALSIGWLFGDFSGLLAAAPTALLQAKYSRDLEREADTYAAALLRANGISPSYLATMLERLDAAQNGGSGAVGGGALDYLSSHPATAERLEALRGE